MNLVPENNFNLTRKMWVPLTRHSFIGKRDEHHVSERLLGCKVDTVVSVATINKPKRDVSMSCLYEDLHVSCSGMSGVNWKPNIRTVQWLKEIKWCYPQVAGNLWDCCVFTAMVLSLSPAMAYCYIIYTATCVHIQHLYFCNMTLSSSYSFGYKYC